MAFGIPKSLSTEMGLKLWPLEHPQISKEERRSQMLQCILKY